MSNLPQLRDITWNAPFSIEAFPPHFGDTEAAPQFDVPAGRETADRQAQILLVGDDAVLQYSRRKILESAGYAVGSVKSDLVVEEMFLCGMQLVLLCHTIPEAVTAHLVSAFARLAPQIPVVRISFLTDELTDGGTPGSVPARPTALLLAVATMLSHD